MGVISMSDQRAPGDGGGTACGRGTINFTSSYDVSFTPYNDHYPYEGLGDGSAPGWGGIGSRNEGWGSPLDGSEGAQSTGSEWGGDDNRRGYLDCTGGEQ